MARFEIHDTFGQPYILTSADPELIAKWFYEMMTLIKPTHQCPIKVTVWPMADLDGKPDWPIAKPWENRLTDIECMQDVIDKLTKQLQNS